MTLRCTVLLLLLSHTSLVAADCDCIWGGPFTQVQVTADIVIAGTVISSKGNSVDLVVNQLLRGTEYLPEIRVWMNPGKLCRPEAKTFPVDSQWVMALHRINAGNPGDFNPNTPNISAGRSGDFSLSKCGGYWLSRKDKLVTGNLVGGTRWERDPEMSPVLLSLVAASRPARSVKRSCAKPPPSTPHCRNYSSKHACICIRKTAAQDLRQCNEGDLEPSKFRNSSSIISDNPQI
jgi:hypothetical protein